MRYIAFFILSIALLAGCSGEEQKQKKQSATDRQADVTANWKTFNESTFDFTFHYPKAATLDVRDPRGTEHPRMVRVRYIGPDNREGSEIRDGFTFYARSINKTGNKSLGDIAEQVFETEVLNGSVIDSVSGPIRMGGHRTYHFSIRNQLGSKIDYSIIGSDGQQVFVTSRVVSIPPNVERGYLDTLATMLETIKPVGGS
jgi:hypothetical protein